MKAARVLHGRKDSASKGIIPVPGDYDGDGITDIAVYRQDTWFILLSSTGATRIQGFGLQGDTPVPGDYDGDGMTDLAVWRPSGNTWFILLSSTGSTQIQPFGDSSRGDIVVPGDYDGDGKTDHRGMAPLGGKLVHPPEQQWLDTNPGLGSTRRSSRFPAITMEMA
ncbi:MAG TPA: VCBS repeat-containing protein [Bryobacteraceae bacterium]|nr:VCBS repeat-containing protein [Bryobacteraceae bacterium]